jgi:phosphoribosyl-AMP cyclohydrolase
VSSLPCAPLVNRAYIPDRLNASHKRFWAELPDDRAERRRQTESHPKGRSPVIQTTDEERDVMMRAWDEAKALQESAAG